MSKAFGKTWWGEQWLNSLNNIDYSNRLPRGSSYARGGAVTKIDIKENEINAKVQGSRPKPYNVDIILPPFSDRQLSSFIDALAERPVIISRLLNRELDPEVLDVAENSSLKVFPGQWTDLTMNCSCPDWAVPCKHLAAVIYKVSAEIDNNPFLVFSLHKVDLLAELNKRGIFVKSDSLKIPALTDLYFEREQKITTEASFNPEKAYARLSYSDLPSLHQPLNALLSDYPAFYQGSGNFKEKYTSALSRIVKKAERIIQGKIDLQSVLDKTLNEQQQVTTHSLSKVVVDEKQQAKVLVSETTFSLSDFLVQLEQIPFSKAFDYQPSTTALHTVFYTALHLVAKGAIVPQVVQQSDKTFGVRWLPAMLSKEVRQLMEKLQDILPPGIFFCQEKTTAREVNCNQSVNLLALFLTELIAIFAERNFDDLFLNLFFRKHAYHFGKPGEAALNGGMAAWIQKYYLTQGNYKPQVVVEERADSSFLISLNIYHKDETLSKPNPLGDILTLKKFDQQRYEILQSTTQLSSFISGLDRYINSKGEELIVMDENAFTPFLFQRIPAIQLLDIDILLPKSLQQILKPKLSLKLKKKAGRSFLRLDQLLEFDWQIAIGDTLMDEKEFKKLLHRSDSLIKYKSNYIYVNKEELEKLHKHFSSKKELSAFEILRTALSGEYFGAPVSLTKEVRDLIDELNSSKEIPLPQGIHAQLRPYQKRGYSFMYRNAKIGFGSVIADDMGLGKTLQVITTLLKYKEEGLLKDKKALIVVPTGLLTNWLAEIEKFAPSLSVHVFYGANRKLEEKTDIVLTSYGVARTEAPMLKKLPWHSLIIDEAQNIKNQDTAQAKAIKGIAADNFIAMSGTPVENRLSEFWSIFDYSNRGLLGNSKEFKDLYATPIEIYNDKTVAEKLKKVTAPFMMRRLKTDKSIISDLPDKIEMDCFSVLAKEQAGLYEKTLEEAMKEIEGIDTSDKKRLFVRQGLVLQMILALKQICNHPAQFLKNNVLDPSLSGKLNLLFDKLDSIRENNEKVLIFTQFAEMGRILQDVIAERYNESPLYYHGGCSLKQRKEMVENFQTNHADRIFILSLKAAGTGLNLTAASHVIHYDLWWNPAVEAQATDRAYRIGQKSNVMVHRFITKNTFEERINDMIQSKKALADMSVAAGENWIGNLSNKELKELLVMS
ncbi:SNF2-related protein [Desertivirga xinjiangensis]|uniref:SNF2-related protein n=1 Tax=Desertivirga xinjiangensis TaxID=539206 RepID=UPI0021088C8A|nr:SNF2-related protein [Pedobacter xinjiangensis]